VVVVVSVGWFPFVVNVSVVFMVKVGAMVGGGVESAVVEVVVPVVPGDAGLNSWE
jgi:hypothetical protein